MIERLLVKVFRTIPVFLEIRNLQGISRPFCPQFFWYFLFFSDPPSPDFLFDLPPAELRFTIYYCEIIAIYYKIFAILKNGPFFMTRPAGNPHPPFYPDIPKFVPAWSTSNRFCQSMPSGSSVYKVDVVEYNSECLHANIGGHHQFNGRAGLPLQCLGIENFGESGAGNGGQNVLVGWDALNRKKLLVNTYFLSFFLQIKGQ